VGTNPIAVKPSQLVESRGIPLLSGGTQAFLRPFRILHDPQPPQVAETSVVITARITRRRDFAKQTEGNLGIPFDPASE
jgi:hypothetical protein